MFGLKGPWNLNLVNQALRMKIAYWSEKKENTRDRSVPNGSDKIFYLVRS